MADLSSVGWPALAYRADDNLVKLFAP